MDHWPRIALAALLLAAIACASEGKKDGGPIRGGLYVPFTSTEVQVQGAVARSVYIDTILAGSKFSGRLFFTMTEHCRRMLREGATLKYTRSGPWGELSDSEGVCVPVGIGALSQWRDRNRKPRRAGMQRSPAHFEVVFQDDEYALARGRFPMAAALGWTRADDTIAVVPLSETCREPLERGQAAVEYRTNGPEALLLISPSGRCAIEGLIIPQGKL